MITQPPRPPRPSRKGTQKPHRSPEIFPAVARRDHSEFALWGSGLLAGASISKVNAEPGTPAISGFHLVAGIDRSQRNRPMVNPQKSRHNLCGLGTLGSASVEEFTLCSATAVEVTFKTAPKSAGIAEPFLRTVKKTRRLRPNLGRANAQAAVCLGSSIKSAI